MTGASSFLGYHVAKRLNEQGIRPRVLELQGSKLDPLKKLDVEQCAGHLEDPQALERRMYRKSTRSFTWHSR